MNSLVWNKLKSTLQDPLKAEPVNLKIINLCFTRSKALLKSPSIDLEKWGGSTKIHWVVHSNSTAKKNMKNMYTHISPYVFSSSSLTFSSSDCIKYSLFNCFQFPHTGFYRSWNTSLHGCDSKVDYKKKSTKQFYDVSQMR